METKCSPIKGTDVRMIQPFPFMIDGHETKNKAETYLTHMGIVVRCSGTHYIEISKFLTSLHSYIIPDAHSVSECK
jgi:hypothetical protein